jgi:hypothetical protein
MSAPDHETQNKGAHGTFGGMSFGDTKGVKGIEAAFSRAGGSTHHTPGSASKLGSQEQNGANEGKGFGSGKKMAVAHPDSEVSLY